ncbi:MAG: type IV pilus modification protein PilV [Gammaproteobacteria bacterium]|nr:type IV pilus modification protein PilV [Gammaproteobacteria bacterium]
MQINKQPAGFTLIEILIAVVILSIGLLGMAGIQLQGLRGTTSSTLRSDATILANDIAERVHANIDGVSVGAAQNTHYSDINTSTIDCNSPPTLCSASPGTPAVAACALAGGASAGGSGSMAESDIFEFACGLDGAGGVNNVLPGGGATITCNSAGCPFGSELTVNVNWSEVDPNGDPNNQTVTLVFVP